MICKVSKEEAAAINVISDQVFALLNASCASGSALASLTNLSMCSKSSAILHAALNVAMVAALGHRKTHGQMIKINSLKDLKSNPKAFLELIEDVNEIFSGICRGIDPGNDYLLNLFRMEKKS
jgi:hypothetical protein